MWVDSIKQCLESSEKGYVNSMEKRPVLSAYFGKAIGFRFAIHKLS